MQKQSRGREEWRSRQAYVQTEMGGAGRQAEAHREEQEVKRLASKHRQAYRHAKQAGRKEGRNAYRQKRAKKQSLAGRQTG
jgi:hypothetical protein